MKLITIEKTVLNMMIDFTKNSVYWSHNDYKCRIYSITYHPV